MFEFRRLYCAHAKLHAPFPFDGLLVRLTSGLNVTHPQLNGHHASRLNTY